MFTKINYRKLSRPQRRELALDSPSHLRCCFALLAFVAFAFSFTGCAVTSSGNMLGEAAVLKYSKEDNKYRFIDVGMTVATGDEDHMISSPHHSSTVGGFSVNANFNFYSLDYALAGQKGGLFFSVPVTIPMDVGIRPSFVQWIGPFYLGAGTSLVGGYYSDDRKGFTGRQQVFVLYNVGGGFIFNMGESFALGAYANYERMALNSGGSKVKNYDPLPVLSFYENERYPAYAFRKNVMTLGVSTFFDLKKPLGFYAECSPESLMYNDGWWKFRWGIVILY